MFTPAILQGIGPTELLIVLAIVLLVFGPKRLPQLGRQLGAGMREFKDSITGSKDGESADDDEDDRAPAALGRPGGEAAAEQPVDGEVVPERR